MHTLWVLIVGAVIGAIAGAYKQRSINGLDCEYRCRFSWFIYRRKILGSWGPHVAGMAIVPSIIGAVILVAVVSFFFGRKNS